jgi:protein TonB
MAKVNIFNPEWVDMVFEGKNHEYGAFILRKDSSKRHLVALSIASALFITGVAGPGLLKSILPEKKVDESQTVISLTDINLDKPNEAEKIVAALPPPPPVRNTIRFTPPVITPDEEVADDEQEMKTQQEVQATSTAIGAVDFDKGTDDAEAPVATSETVTEEVQEPFVIVEQMPEFPGGQGELLKYLSKNIVYPASASENGIQGIVYLRFVIDKNGKVSKVTVLRSLHRACDAEAVRVVEGMPNWKAGRQGGVAVPVSYTLPVRFTLQN